MNQMGLYCAVFGCWAELLRHEQPRIEKMPVHYRVEWAALLNSSDSDTVNLNYKNNHVL